MLRRQAVLNESWGAEHLAAFGLGLGLSTGSLAAAFLGSEDRVEYTVVGDSVNLAHRLQQHARAGQIILSEASLAALSLPTRVMRLDPLQIRGRRAPETAFLIEPDAEIHRTAI
jgi:class 3 adenylate cyclase